MSFHLYKCMLLLLIGTLAGCSSQVAGGTSETTSGTVCTGRVYLTDGITPAIGAYIYVRSADYIADTSSINIHPTPNAITDSLGFFSIDSVMSGAWTIELNYQNISVEKISIQNSQFEKPILTLGNIILQAAATIQGQIDRSGLDSTEQAYVQIYGLDRVVRADNKGHFSFQGLPQGNLVLRVHSSVVGHGVIPRDTIELNAAEVRNAGFFRLPVDFWRDTVTIRTILDSNGLTDMPISAVAKSAEPNTRINELNLSRLGLVTLSSELAQLRLRHLRLNYNLLDSLPSNIGEMVSMNDLSVTENALTSLPESIVNITHMTYLNLDSNQLNNLPANLVAWINLHSTNAEWANTQKP